MDSMDELRSPSLPTSPAAPIIVFPSPSMLSVLQLLGTIRCPEKPRAAHRVLVALHLRSNFAAAANTSSAIARWTLRTLRCLVAERCWDQVRWAIEANAWRFDGCAKPARPRRS